MTAQPTSTPAAGAPERLTRRYVSRLTPAQRSLQARLAAQSRWAKTAPGARSQATAPARAALAAQWDAAPDPDLARRAHMTRLALASSRARKSA